MVLAGTIVDTVVGKVFAVVTAGTTVVAMMIKKKNRMNVC